MATTFYFYYLLVAYCLIYFTQMQNFRKNVIHARNDNETHYLGLIIGGLLGIILRKRLISKSKFWILTPIYSMIIINETFSKLERDCNLINIKKINYLAVIISFTILNRKIEFNRGILNYIFKIYLVRHKEELESS